MKRYTKPFIQSQKSFETSALLCGKTYTPPIGSHHFSSAYDTFTGHLGPGMGASSSMDPAQAGIGHGEGGTSLSYHYNGLCSNWCVLSS